MKICPTCKKTYPDDFSHCPRDGARLTAQVTETEAELAAGLSHRYRIVRRLGAGGMGTVFLAQQIGVGNRPVALEVLNRKLLDDPEFLLRFQNEAGSTGLIHHPNVVAIYESAQADDGTPYIAMEFLEGESLREALKRGGALAVPEVAEILQQAARGLNAAHKHGIIHRDLKPDNIFLARGDEGERVVKVVDFGIAKLRESSTHTQTGMVLGTPAYMSCEQASGMRSDELDARSDIYSLGVVVYEMLSGRVPFHSDTPLGYLRKHMLEAPPPFRAAAPGLSVPRDVEAVVMKALAKNRDERYTTALDFARDFARAACAPTPAEASDFSPTVVADPLDGGRAEQEHLAREKLEAERREKEKAAAEQAAGKKAEQQQRERADQRQRFDQFVNEGKVAFDAHDYAKAVGFCEEALKLNPDAPGLREAFETAQKKLREETARPEKPTPPPGPPAIPPKSSKKMKYAAIAGAAVVFLILLIAGLQHHSPPANPQTVTPPGGVGTTQIGTDQQVPEVQVPAQTPSAPATNGQHFEKYAGKYPSDFLKAEPDVERRLRALLGGNYDLFMERLQTETPFRDVKGTLVATGCKAHECGSEEAVLLIDLSDGKVYGAIHSDTYGGKFKTFSEDPPRFPSDALKHAFEN